MQELNVIQDRSNGLMTLAPSEGVNVLYDMRLQRVIKGERENSFDREYEEGSSASDSPSSDWEETIIYVISKEEKEDNKKKKLLPLNNGRRWFPNIFKEKNVKGLFPFFQSFRDYL